MADDADARICSGRLQPRQPTDELGRRHCWSYPCLPCTTSVALSPRKVGKVCCLLHSGLARHRPDVLWLLGVRPDPVGCSLLAGARLDRPSAQNECQGSEHARAPTGGLAVQNASGTEWTMLRSWGPHEDA